MWLLREHGSRTTPAAPAPGRHARGPPADARQHERSRPGAQAETAADAHRLALRAEQVPVARRINPAVTGSAGHAPVKRTITVRRQGAVTPHREHHARGVPVPAELEERNLRGKEGAAHAAAKDEGPEPAGRLRGSADGPRAGSLHCRSRSGRDRVEGAAAGGGARDLDQRGGRRQLLRRRGAAPRYRQLLPRLGTAVALAVHQPGRGGRRDAVHRDRTVARRPGLEPDPVVHGHRRQR